MFSAPAARGFSWRSCTGPALGSRNRHRSANFIVHSSRPSTLYELLGVPVNAIQTDVKGAYRQLAQLYHPDVNDSDAAKTKFRAINLAYEVLSDQELKRQYDQYGLDTLGTKYTFLREFFGGSDAVHGCEKEVEVAAMGQCPDCEGSGLKPGCRPEDCDICRGAGEILRTRQLSGGRATLLGVCPACGGRGLQCVVYCPRCKGEGRARVQRSINVKIPAGAEDGRVVRLQQLGDAGRFGGKAGHLYIRVRVEGSADLRRVGHDLCSTVVISVYDAVLGTSLQVPTVRGSQMLEVPPGTQHGEELVVLGAGIAYSLGGVVHYGNAVFQVKLQLHDASREQQLLLRRLRQVQQATADAAAQSLGRPSFADVFDVAGFGEFGDAEPAGS